MLRIETPRRLIAVFRVGLVAVAILGGDIFRGGFSARADEFNSQASLYRQLLAPMTSVIDGKSFREAIVRVAEQAELNIWIDRRVDPTALVNAGQLGPNVYAAIKQIAATRECVVMPVAGVLLIGRPEWVDATADVLIKMTGPSADDPVNVRWDDLTTPGDAIKTIVGDQPEGLQLPHDLWPTTAWAKIDRHVAIALVLAQFDQQPPVAKDLDGNLVGIEFSDPASRGSCRRRYRTDKYAKEFRSALSHADRRSAVKAEGNVLVAQATSKAHRLATDKLIGRMAADVVAKPANEAVFSLKLKERAGAAIGAFAQRAGRKCVIEPDARELAEKVVSLEANNKTLRQLAEMVARNAGLVVDWKEKEVVVSKGPNAG